MTEKPLLVLIGGCNGAGKTTFSRKYLPTIGVDRFLNADEIAKGLSPLDPTMAAVKAGRLLIEELRDQLQQRKSFALESTLSGRTYVRMLREAREAGYHIVLHYLVVPSATDAVRRVAMRVRTGGHHVPPEDVERRFQRSRRHLLEDYAPLADEWWVWDNASPPPRMLAQSGTCTLEELEKLITGANLMEPPVRFSHDEHTRLAQEAHLRATEEAMNYFMRMEIEVPEEMLSPEWKQKFADFKRKMAAP